MLNIQKRHLLLLAYLIKPTALFSAAPRPQEMPETLPTNLMVTVSSLGFCAGLAVGTGHPKSSLPIMALTGYIVDKKANNFENKKVCSALFTIYAATGLFFGLMGSADISKKRSL